MSQFQPSVIGTAGSLLRAAGSFLGGWVGTAGDSAYEIQRAVGGKAHDEALAAAVAEGKKRFHQCSRCGRWVCPEICWNADAGQCEECAPNFQEEMASAHAHAKAEAARQQLAEKAMATDYVANIDMSAVSVIGARPGAKGRFCPECGTNAGQAKFCPECGTSVGPATPAGATCIRCGYHSDTPARFCPERGGKMQTYLRLELAHARPCLSECHVREINRVISEAAVDDGCLCYFAVHRSCGHGGRVHHADSGSAADVAENSVASPSATARTGDRGCPCP